MFNIFYALNVGDRLTRPKKCKIVGFVPSNLCFYPKLDSSAEVILSIEEVEAIRLSDYLEMEQDTAAACMNVSRGTFQRIINSARSKTADALVHGKTLRIDGGNYELLLGSSCCRRQSKNCNHISCEKCMVCEECQK